MQQRLFAQDEAVFINSNGYLQYVRNQGKGSQLVHRRVAFKEIWLPNTTHYLNFDQYGVHHKNKDKLDNRPDNLELKRHSDHYYTHFTKDHMKIRDARLDTFNPKLNKLYINPEEAIKENKKLEDFSKIVRVNDESTEIKLSLWGRVVAFIRELLKNK